MATKRGKVPAHLRVEGSWAHRGRRRPEVNGSCSSCSAGSSASISSRSSA